MKYSPSLHILQPLYEIYPSPILQSAVKILLGSLMLHANLIPKIIPP